MEKRARSHEVDQNFEEKKKTRNPKIDQLVEAVAAEIVLLALPGRSKKISVEPRNVCSRTEISEKGSCEQRADQFKLESKEIWKYQIYTLNYRFSLSLNLCVVFFFFKSIQRLEKANRTDRRKRAVGA